MNPSFLVVNLRGSCLSDWLLMLKAYSVFVRTATWRDEKLVVVAMVLGENQDVAVDSEASALMVANGPVA